MKIDKAIERLAYLVKHDYLTMTSMNYDAIKLGREALKRWGSHRQQCPSCFMELLPGETTD